jgi:3-hydroxybutyryl-CoA dehydrogenase
MSSLERIAVLGAGRMGSGIAQVFCAAGHPVRLYDTQTAVLQRAPGAIRAMFELLEQDLAGLERLACSNDLDLTVGDAEVVIEAVPERLALKREIFARLEAAAPAGALLATNTSAIPIADIVAGLATAHRMLGMHFWNPPHLVPLVEVVPSARTDASTLTRAMALLERTGMSPVHVQRDIPGFIGNRLQHALKREAIALVASGVCDARTLDRVVREGFGSRLAVLGPLEQSDLVGLDLTLAIHEVLIPDLDRTPGPHPYLRAKVEAGRTGMAAGAGFSDWTPQDAAAVKARLDGHLAATARARLARIRQSLTHDSATSHRQPSTKGPQA